MYSDSEKEKILNEIFENMIENRKSLTQAIKASPISYFTFFEWTKEDEKYRKSYDYAREIRADLYFEEIIDISKEIEDIDEIKSKNEGIKIKFGDVVQRQRLKVDALKWVVAKMLPVKYGDKIELNQNIKKESEMVVNIDGENVTGELVINKKND